MSAAGARRVASTAFAAVALVLIPVGPALADPPECTAPPPQTLVEGTTLVLGGHVYCSDAENDPLTFMVTTPSHGVAGVSGPSFGYTPDPGYVGPDAFDLTASGGGETSAPATVTITVTANQPPSCPATQPFHVVPDTPRTFIPRDVCVDDAGLANSEIVDHPDHGTLDVSVFGLLYTPAAGYEGSDAFTVLVKDHLGASAQVLVAVSVAPNRAPSCVTPVTRQVPVGGTVRLDSRNNCSDPDGDTFTAQIITPPSHGQLQLVVLGVSADYVANPGYVGMDQMRYRVVDTFDAASNDAVVDFLIGDPPTAQQSQNLPPTARILLPDARPPVLDVGRAGAQRLGAVRRSGLKLRIACDEAGTATIELRVSKRTARRLGIARLIGRATKVLAVGDNEIAVPLKRRAKRRLASVKRVELVALVLARDATGNSVRETLEVALRR